MARPARTPVNASPASLQTPTHDSGPPGSLTLRCRTPPFLASCRFIPAHYMCPSAQPLRRAMMPWVDSDLTNLVDLSSHNTNPVGFRKYVRPQLALPNSHSIALPASRVL